MSGTVLIGRGNQISSVPQVHWEAHLNDIQAHGRERLDFMSPEHHRVRYFVVRELVARARPLTPKYIAGRLGLALDRTIEILADWEERLFFLVRNDAGEVAWGYPVTAEQTPHRLTFDSGEQLYAA